MRRGLSLGVAASLAASLACAACGSSEGSGEAPDADVDAARQMPDASVPDLDAGSDTQADAKKDAISLPSGYCGKLVPTPKFCDDFDDGDLMGLWSANAVQSGLALL